MLTNLVGSDVLEFVIRVIWSRTTVTVTVTSVGVEADRDKALPSVIITNGKDLSTLLLSGVHYQEYATHIVVVLSRFDITTTLALYMSLNIINNHGVTFCIAASYYQNTDRHNLDGFITVAERGHPIVNLDPFQT